MVEIDGILAGLDDSQLAAATCETAVQLALAGPGAGKTKTLTSRFAYLVSRGVNPRRILGVTFTSNAAQEMKERVAQLLGIRSAKSLPLLTFHSFSYRYLRRYPHLFGLKERFPLWEGAQQRFVFVQRRMWWNEDEDILEIIGAAKERMLDPETFAAQLDPEDEIGLKAVEYFRVYEEARKAAGAIDFADMVPLLARTMAENEVLRRSVTGAFDHLLMDEYQDSNPGQIMLADHFIRDGVPTWCVGDDDQTLYSYRAADVKTILTFEERYEGARVHTLERNYRSAPEIVFTFKRLIRNNKARCDKDYLPTVTERGEVVARGYSSPEIEGRQVARAIKALLQSGFVPKQIAVLYRTGATGLPLQTSLQELDIPFEVRGSGDVWQSAAAKLVIGALFYLRDGETAATLARTGTNKRGEILRERLSEVRPLVSKDFTSCCQQVKEIVSAAMPSQASDREKAEWANLVGAVIALATDCKSPEELETKIEEQSAAVKKPPGEAVVLTTIHSAKGLEWDVVFIVGLENGTLPHGSAEVDEERRVAYVAMSRARRLLSLTYSTHRFGQSVGASTFLFEISKGKDRLLIWSRPTEHEADEKLPLLTTAEKRRLAEPPEAEELGLRMPWPLGNRRRRL